MFRHYLRVAIRNLARHKGYSFINVVGLAVGMAFAILILLWVQHEVSFDRFHENSDQLYVVAITNDAGDFHGDYTVGALAEHLQREYPEIVHATRWTFSEWWGLQHGDEEFVSRGRYIDASFFKMFSFPFIHGDPSSVFAEPNSVVITNELANKVFGDENPVGKTLSNHNGTLLTVTGVLEDVPNNSRFQFEFLVSADMGGESLRKWDVKSLMTFVMLDEKATPEDVSAGILEVYNDHNPQDTRNNLYLFPLRDSHLYGLTGDGPIVYVLVFTLAAAAVLLLACFNFMNLTTARSEMRSREIGVKKIVGASRSQLIVQFLSEALLLSFIALIIAIALVELSLPVVNSMFHLQLDLHYSAITITILTGAGLLTGMFAGSYPAFFLSSFHPLSVLKGQGWFFQLTGRNWSGGRRLRGSSMRRLLVVGQFAISIVFVISVMVIFRQVDHMTTMDMGFDKERIVLFNMPRELVPHTATVKNELLQHANIESVAVSAGRLVEWSSSFGIWWEGKQTEEMFDVGFNQVDYDFAATFGIEIVDGRFFSREFPSDASEALVINEATVRAMGITDPVGKKVTIAPGSSVEMEGVIIGVVKDFHTESAHKEIRPFMMGLTEQGYLMCARLGDGNTSGTLQFMRDKVREIVPDANIYSRFFRDEVMQLYAVELLTGTVLVFIMILAIFISSLGLFGLAAYTTERRTKEIGIRKALGASAGNLVRLLSKEFVLLVLIANIVAWPVAHYIMNRWLEGFVFRVDVGWITPLLAASLALVIALITVSTQAFRAASSNPVDSLKYE